jgi:glycosyltransferase involved in cell wall biosynthesis
MRDAGAPSLVETLKGYLTAGWHVDYLTCRKRKVQGGSHEMEIDPGLGDLRVLRFELPPSQMALGGRVQAKVQRLRDFPKAADALRGYLESESPALIYAYEEGAIAAVARLATRSCLPAPVVNRFQGTILGYRYASLAHCVRKYESWRALRCRADLYVMTDDGTFGDRALRHWNRYVTADNLLFIRNGINKGAFGGKRSRDEALRELGLGSDRLYLLTVSRLAGWKRVDRAIRLIAAIRDRIPAARLLICGDGEVRGELEKLTKSLRVTECVHFLGSQPRQVVAELLSAADVFLSLYDISNCGNPLFEALLSGCCIVTLDNGGTGGVMVDGYNGRLVPMEKEYDLPEIVSGLLTDASQRVLLRHGAQEWASRELSSWEDRMATEVQWIESRLRLRCARLG